MRSTLAFLLFALAAMLAGNAAAMTCYTVLNSGDSVIYRDTYPPRRHLSDSGAADRAAMRRRGEHMISMETRSLPAHRVLHRRRRNG